jgi:hypothetical protein
MQIFDLYSYFFDYEQGYSCYSTSGLVTDLLKALNDLNLADDCLDPKYTRKEWRHWIDEDRDGLNTRQEVLYSESLIAPSLRNDSKKVIAGRWYDPYTDKIFSKPQDLDIDHFVPLGEAHKSGGCNWDAAQKKYYANALMYEEELIAVSKRANRQKGQKDPAKWLPTNEDYHCEYVSNWVLIKNRWGLWIDIEEKIAIEEVIQTKCQWAC